MAVVSSQRKIGPGMRCDVPREVHHVHTFPTGSIFRAALCRPRTSGACLPYGGEGLVGYCFGESTTGERVTSASADVSEEGGTGSHCFEDCAYDVRLQRQNLTRQALIRSTLPF